MSARKLFVRGTRSFQRRFSSGQSMVELALSMNILLVVMLAAVEMGRMMYMAITINDAARAAVEYGAQNLANASDTSGMQNIATQAAKDVSGVTATATHYCQCQDGS